MAPIRALTEAHMAGMETGVPMPMPMTEVLGYASEVRGEMIYRGRMTWEQARLSDLVRPGPWAPCDVCGEPTRVVRKESGRAVHMLCFAAEAERIERALDAKWDADERRRDAGRTTCRQCFCISVENNGRCQNRDCVSRQQPPAGPMLSEVLARVPLPLTSRMVSTPMLGDIFRRAR